MRRRAKSFNQTASSTLLRLQLRQTFQIGKPLHVASQLNVLSRRGEPVLTDPHTTADPVTLAASHNDSRILVGSGIELARVENDLIASPQDSFSVVVEFDLKQPDWRKRNDIRPCPVLREADSRDQQAGTGECNHRFSSRQFWNQKSAFAATMLIEESQFPERFFGLTRNGDFDG